MFIYLFELQYFNLHIDYVKFSRIGNSIILNMKISKNIYIFNEINIPFLN